MINEIKKLSEENNAQISYIRKHAEEVYNLIIDADDSEESYIYETSISGKYSESKICIKNGEIKEKNDATGEIARFVRYNGNNNRYCLYNDNHEFFSNVDIKTLRLFVTEIENFANFILDMLKTRNSANKEAISFLEKVISIK